MLIKRCTTTLLIISSVLLAWSQRDTTEVFGIAGKDFNRPSKMIKLPGGNLIWAGEWNNEGILMKITPDGTEIKKIFISYKTGATTKIKDLLLDQDNTLLAASECAKCSGVDSINRIALFRIDTALDHVLAQSLIAGNSASSPLLYNPSIARNKNGLLLIGTQPGQGDNYEDIFLASIQAGLDTLWTKSMNTCSDCFFEFPVRMIATDNGFTSFVFHNYTDSATIYHFDLLGNILWKQRSFTLSGVTGGAIAALGQKIYIGVGVKGLPQDPFYYAAVVLTYDEKTGTPLNATSLSDPYTDRSINSLEFAKNGNLIVGYRRLIQSFNGSLLSSQVLRLDLLSNNPKFIDSRIIPNPNENTNMAVVHAIPLNDDGSKFGVIGTRGGNRTFYYTNVDLAVASHDIAIAKGFKFSITPNPTMGHQAFTIHLPESIRIDHHAVISIFAMNGKLINQINSAPHQYQYTLSGLPQGIYTVVINTGHSVSSQKLLVF